MYKNILFRKLCDVGKPRKTLFALLKCNAQAENDIIKIQN